MYVKPFGHIGWRDLEILDREICHFDFWVETVELLQEVVFGRGDGLSEITRDWTLILSI